MIHSDYLSSMGHGTQRACQLQWYSTKIFPNISGRELRVAEWPILKENPLRNGWVRYSEFSWQLNQELTIELNSALLHNWSKFDIPYKHWPKFDKWHSWTYFYWTWFDSLNHIRDLESPNLFIKTSIILIRELKNLNLIIKSLMILIRDFNFPNLIHWTCLNWT